MRLDVFTLFPEAFDWFASQRHVRNARAAGCELRLIDYREFTPLKGGRVDDSPYGGGPGMVLRVDVVDAALEGVYGAEDRPRMAALTPAGRPFDEPLARELAAELTTAGSASAPPGPAPSEPARPAPPPPGLALLCGRYEGFDQRVHEHLVDDEISIGPYVLAGGELAAMVVADAVIRKLPGALGDQESATEESFSEALGGAPEYPHFTRPESYRGWEVPEILRSGDHGQIEAWRREQSRLRGSAASESSPPAPKR